MRKSIDERLLDEMADQFLSDDDLNVELENYARGLITEKDLIERLEFLKGQAGERARRLIDPSETEASEQRAEVMGEYLMEAI